MELAIQVAVRIAPAPIFRSGVSAKDDNGNDSNRIVETENKANNNPDEEPDNVKCEPPAPAEHDTDGELCCVHAISTPCFMGLMAPGVPAALPTQLDNGSIANGLVQVGPHSFPVSHALPPDCTQHQVYHQTVFPLINLLLEGFDASVVTYGQRGSGKTYTLYGPGFDCVYGEADQGIVQRCAREIFSHMANHPERTYAVNIGWVEIQGDAVRDLLGVGNVLCESISDVFHWLQVGLSRRAAQSAKENSESHTLFTLTLEQHWISKESLIQHRLSTASFSDLCATDRLFMLDAQEQPTSVPRDLGLKALEQVVCQLTDASMLYGSNGNVSYQSTTLTTLLKDSFGGRAQTLLILCVSPFERHINETICNLQFAFKVQCVRNFVIMNIFSDDSTPISPEMGGGVGGAGPELPRVVGNMAASENFGLQFAASQWFKLVSNAEGLFSKLVSSNALSDLDKEQIEEWLFLKQECEECLSSSEALRSQKHLNPIQEAEEPEETVSEPETSCQQNSDNESDSESQRPDLEEKLDSLLEEFRSKTDSLVKEKYKEFMQNHPKGVTESQDHPKKPKDESHETHSKQVEKMDERKVSVGGRRRSIQPGASLSSAEIAMLNRVASEQKTPKLPEDLIDSSADMQHATQLRAAINSPMEIIQKKLRKLDTDIEARHRQIKEVEQTMQLKQNIIQELVKNSETRSTAKQRFHKKKSKLEAEYEKTKKQLAKALLQGKEKCEVERLGAVISHLEQRLQDLTSMKHIAGESGHKVKKLQQSLHESKKVVDDLQKKVKKEKKARDQLDAELRALREKENSRALLKIEGAAGALGGHNDGEPEAGGKHLKEVQARIAHLDHVLKEKSDNLADGDASTEQKEPLRHEIRNLRRTRDHLLEQRCSLDRKLKRDKMLSYREERKLLECDEAIEAIDAAIEFKNELICGHKSIDTSERLQREKGEQMLMARLNKLSAEEMRTLLYKYFTKVIDLRDSSRKLEVQLMQLERERDAWEWKERVLSNAVRQARLEGERNAVLLQRQHEMKLTLMLRHLAEETSASSASFSDVQQQQQQQHHRYLRAPGGGGLALAPHPGQTASSSQYSDSDFDLEFYKQSLKAPKHGEMEMCPMPDALAKYKPLDKLKEKERETKNKLFAKFQVLTRYAGQSAMAMAHGGGSGGAGGGGVADDGHHAAGGGHKKKDKDAAAGVVATIPQENLKRLIASTPSTRVTRQKNKIIIQDASRKN